MTSATLAPATGLTALANCVQKRSSFLTLSWVASTSSRLTGYRISRADGSTPPAVLATVGPTATRYDDTNITKRTTYTYTVEATYLGWASSPATVTVTTGNRC